MKNDIVLFATAIQDSFQEKGYHAELTECMKSFDYLNTTELLILRSIESFEHSPTVPQLAGIIADRVIKMNFGGMAKIRIQEFVPEGVQ